MKKTMLCAFIAVLVLSSLPTMAFAQDGESDCFVEPEVMTTADGVEFVRTPDACFENLPDWDYEAQYVEIDGLRQAYVDVGTGESGETILLLHGQPSWSYLYRHMIPVLAEDGHRVIAMDHLGFGRSDKPIDWEYYTYVDHVERLEVFIQELELEQGNLTAFVQDWGSLIGLQVVGTNPDWFDRVVVGNGMLPVFEQGTTPAPLPSNAALTRNFYHTMITSIPAEQPDFYDEDGNQILTLVDASGLPIDVADMMPTNDDSDMGSVGVESGFGIWIDYARNDERFRPEVVVEAMTYFDLTDEEEAAYAAPFPTRITMGGVRAFPGLINQMPGLTQDSWASLGEFEKPFLTIWGDNDPGNLGQLAVQQNFLDHVPGSEGWDHVRLEEASHFLQDDQGEEIARRINEFIAQSVVEPIETSVDGDADEGQLGFELLEVVSPSEIRAWVVQDQMTLEEFEALELTEGWMKNQPRDGDVDRGEFTRSPDGEFDGDLDIQEFFGYEWLHTATITEVNVSVDEQGILTGAYVSKYHRVIYNDGEPVTLLISPDGDQYIRIGRDAGRATDEFALSEGWQLVEYVPAGDLVVDLPRPTLVIRTENEDSFQGPIPALDLSTENE